MDYNMQIYYFNQTEKSLKQLHKEAAAEIKCNGFLLEMERINYAKRMDCVDKRNLKQLGNKT